MERVNTRPTPSEVVQTAVTAFEAQDWPGLAVLVQEERLIAFQKEQIAFLVAWSQSRETYARARAEGVQMFMLSYDDTLPPETLAQVADIEIAVFSPPRRIGDLAALSPAAFFETWCQAAYGAPTSRLGRSKSQVDRSVMGHVFEGDSIAHVVYRSPRFYAADRMPLKWSANGWRLLLNEDIGWRGDLDLHLDES